MLPLLCQFPGKAALTCPVNCPLSPRTQVQAPLLLPLPHVFPPETAGPGQPRQPQGKPTSQPARTAPPQAPPLFSELFPSLGNCPRGGSGTSSLRKACLGGDGHTRGFTLYPGITCTVTAPFTPHPPIVNSYQSKLKQAPQPGAWPLLTSHGFPLTPRFPASQAPS